MINKQRPPLTGRRLQIKVSCTVTRSELLPLRVNRYLTLCNPPAFVNVSRRPGSPAPRDTFCRSKLTL